VANDEDLGGLRWTVDTPGDLEFVRAMAAHLGERRHEAGFDELLAAARAVGDRQAGDA
jgi:spore coat polysaccharide biosynthesis protein SpsF (cytidylyltransferase family)